MGRKAFLWPLLLLSLMLWVQPITLVSAEPVHDVAIIDVKTFSPVHGNKGGSPPPPLTPVIECYSTWTVYINVTVINEWDFAESFNVTAYYNETAIGLQAVNLAPGANTALTFIWDVPSIPKAYPYPLYIISAEASVVDGETDTADNFMVDGSVKVKWWGDVNGDGKVNIYDLVKVALSWKKQKTDPSYDPQCDFDGDGDVDLWDLTKLALNWKKGPIPG